MADGKLKLLKMYGKMHKMTKHLVQNQPELYIRTRCFLSKAKGYSLVKTKLRQMFKTLMRDRACNCIE